MVFCALVSCSGPNAEEYYTQGRQLREAGEPVAAMQAFIAATRVHSSEHTYKARSFSNMATMCRIGERHELAYDLYGQSAVLFLKAEDTLAYALALNNMAWEQAVQGHKEAALALIDSAVAIGSDEWLLAKTAETQAAAYLYAAEYDSVLLFTQHVPVESVYFDMLRAQAYTFLGQSDSALTYARRVTEQTDNPRYLDDAYYILTQCDSTADADQIRALAATRTDVQRQLERNDAEWTEAMLLAEACLLPAERPHTWFWWVLAGIGLVSGGMFVWWMSRYRRRHSNSLKQQCRVLKQSKDLRADLHWNDYTQFCAVCNTQLSGIASKLEQRGLSEREIRFCVLVLIGLSYAEMAEILFRAESGIGKDKYTIAKRLGVSVKDLQKTLQQIAEEK